MKQKIFPIILALALSACTFEQDVVIDNPQGDAEVGRRNTETLLNYALSAYTKLVGDNSRSDVMPGELRKIESVTTSRSGEDEEYALYSVDMGEENGFVILTDCEYVAPVLAVVETGCYEDNQENDGLQYYLDMARNYIENSPLAIVDPTLPQLPHYRWREEVTDTSGYRVVEPQLEVWWGQDAIYSTYCPSTGEPFNPNMPTGCGPTAMGMVLSFLEYPELNITFNGRNEKLIPDWTAIKKHRYLMTNCYTGWFGGEYCFASNESHDNIAKILRQMGEICQTTYTRDGAGTTNDGILKGLNSLNIRHSAIQNYFTNSHKLENNTIFIMFGENPNNSQTLHGNHIFLVDGVKYLAYQIIEYVYDVDPNQKNLATGEYFKTLIETNIIANYYSNMVHVVWGFDNDGVGYYNDCVFDMNQPGILDKDATNSNNYSYKSANFITIYKD